MEENGENVSEIVEKYKNKYPQSDRKVLRELILSKNTHINPRTLDRHLKKAFEKPSGYEKPSEILEPNRDELSAFKEFPRNRFACSFAEEHVKRNYPEWYRRNKKTFDEMRRVNYGFSGFITNPQPAKAQGKSKRQKTKIDRQ